MNGKRMEYLAAGLTVVGLFAAILGPIYYEQAHAQAEVGEGANVITLTGVAANGVWTDQDVTAENYWYRTFPAAHPVLTVGQPVVLRLKSSDVTHEFYLPELGVGPVTIYPGHVEMVRFTPDRAGTFTIYCTKVCGDSHFAMKGQITVVEPGAVVAPAAEAPQPRSAMHAPDPPDDLTGVKLGKYLFQTVGCVTCHGENGEGGVDNFNFTTTQVPGLKFVSERVGLYEPDHAKLIVDLLGKGIDPQSLKDDPPLDGETYSEFLKQFQTMRDVIKHGRPPARKDADRPAPPLVMLAWGQKLSDDQIDAILAYLIDLFPWDEE